MFSRKLRTVASLATAFSLITAGIAVADNLNNNADSAGVTTITAGGSTTITYQLVGNSSPDGDISGCNVDLDNAATVTVTAPSGVTATPSSFQFTKCGPDGRKTVTFSSSTTGSHSITHAITGGKTGSKYNNNSDFTLTVNAASAINRAPVVSSAALDAHGVEGGTLTTSGAFTDPDNDPLTLTADNTAGTFTDTGNGTWTWSLATTDDVALATVTVTASDGKATATDSFDYSARNADPVVTGVTVTPSASDACAVSISATFTDAGSGDTHTASIGWGDGSSDSVDPATSPVAGSHTYTSAGTFTIEVTVTDDDGGVGSKTGSFATRNRPSAILQPINTDGSSSFKLGSTIPVKITVSDCGGTLVDTLSPVVSLTRVSGTTSSVNEVVSSSAADSGNTMRWSSEGSQYISNLSTRKSQFNAGNDLTEGAYELKITDGSFASTVVASFKLRK